MTNVKCALVAATVCLLPLSAQANDISFYGGVQGTLTFDDSLSHSGEALEGYVGVENAGLFAELWLGTLDDPTDDFEYELSIGYGGDIDDKLSYGLSATGFFLNNSGHQNNELAGGLYFAASESFNFGGELAWDPETDDLNKAIVFDWAANEKITFEGEIGLSDADNNTYWELAALYDFGNGFGTGLLYEDTNDAPGQVSILMTYDF